MDAQRWEKVREVFQTALDHPAGEWPALLDHLCGDDGALRAEVEALLDGHRAAGDFLDQPVIGRVPDESWSRDSCAGRKVGSYQLVRRLGLGGMGAVYLAVRADEEFRKRVALKVLRPGMDGEDIVRRFRAERQILAGLDHPNVARLLDGGTTEDALPYFVMEYVEGRPIDEYCDSRQLDTEARLELFRTVCSAVQYAHRNLVVHRDLKPSNILVTSEGTPKLLDFGIAKLLNPELASPELAPTATLLRLMTPDYASPEQVRGEPITTAADVYSLGVLLYYLLTGHRPYRVRNRSPVEILRLICEQEPTSPSTAVLGVEEVSGPDGGTTTVTPEMVGKARGDGPAKLHRRLSGDLDNIVLTALRKEPARRYASVEQLAEDIRRHLNGHPVVACKDTLLYRSRKFVHRHRVGVAVAATFVAACLAFGIVMGIQRAEVVRERDRSEEERLRSERVTELLVGLFEVSDPYKPAGPISAEEILGEGARRLESELAEEPEIQATLMATIGSIYVKLGLLEDAAPLLTSALETRRRIFGERHAATADSLQGLGDLFTKKGDQDAAERFFREALAVRRAVFGDQHPDVARSLNGIAETLWARREYRDAEPLLRQALAVARKCLGEEHPEVAYQLMSLASVLKALGRYEEAEALHLEALAMFRKTLGSEHPRVAESLNNLASLFRATGRYEKAEMLYKEALELRRKALGDEHPAVAVGLNNLAMVLRDRQAYDEARAKLEQSLALGTELLGAEHPKVVATRKSLAGLLHEFAGFRRSQGRLAEAEELYRQAAPMLRQTFGAEHSLPGWNSALLAGLLEERGSFREAESLASAAVFVLRSSLPPEHWKLAAAEGFLAASFLGEGRFEEAEVLLVKSYLALEQARSQPDSAAAAAKRLPYVRQHLAELYEATGEPEKASRYLNP